MSFWPLELSARRHNVRLAGDGRSLNRLDIQEYVLRHVEFTAGHYEYSLWDRAEFGAAGLNNQLSDIDSLDDCGSFGALAILADRIRSLKGVRKAGRYRPVHHGYTITSCGRGALSRGRRFPKHAPDDVVRRHVHERTVPVPIR